MKESSKSSQTRKECRKGAQRKKEGGLMNEDKTGKNGNERNQLWFRMKQERKNLKLGLKRRKFLLAKQEKKLSFKEGLKQRNNT